MKAFARPPEILHSAGRSRLFLKGITMSAMFPTQLWPDEIAKILKEQVFTPDSVAIKSPSSFSGGKPIDITFQRTFEDWKEASAWGKAVAAQIRSIATNIPPIRVEAEKSGENTYKATLSLQIAKEHANAITEALVKNKDQIERAMSADPVVPESVRPAVKTAKRVVLSPMGAFVRGIRVAIGKEHKTTDYPGGTVWEKQEPLDLGYCALTIDVFAPRNSWTFIIGLFTEQFIFPPEMNKMLEDIQALLIASGVIQTDAETEKAYAAAAGKGIDPRLLGKKHHITEGHEMSNPDRLPGSQNTKIYRTSGSFAFVMEPSDMGRIGPLMQQHAAEIYNIISGGAVPERKPLLGGEPAGTEPGGAR